MAKISPMAPSCHDVSRGSGRDEARASPWISPAASRFDRSRSRPIFRHWGSRYDLEAAVTALSSDWQRRFAPGLDALRRRRRRRALALTLDGSGNAYVTGENIGPKFPTTTGGYDQTPNGDVDASRPVLRRQRSCTSTCWVRIDDGLALTVDGIGSALSQERPPGIPVTPRYDASQMGLRHVG